MESLKWNPILVNSPYACAEPAYFHSLDQNLLNEQILQNVNIPIALSRSVLPSMISRLKIYSNENVNMIRKTIELIQKQGNYCFPDVGKIATAHTVLEHIRVELSVSREVLQLASARVRGQAPMHSVYANR